MTQNNIDRHLGRDAQGNKKPAYIMRENVDPSLLVAIPRKRYSLDLQTAMYGGDFWNCTELMFEINNQQIVQMPIQFFIPCNAPPF